MNPIYLDTRFACEEYFGQLPESFAIITAYATTGEQWTQRKNIEADGRLWGYLESQFDMVKRITGYSPVTSHAEPGWLVSCGFDKACDIGSLFKQDAIYWVHQGQLFVSYCGEQRLKVKVGSAEELFDAS